jgi:hypothetical protein
MEYMEYSNAALSNSVIHDIVINWKLSSALHDLAGINPDFRLPAQQRED